ncbi:MAG TPA: alpha/beta hydrolase-fold protein [Thermoguttaceae bacterium]|nr:alpha/beta hydrolase-fold protein [Thermoguttaceae bacterium]
MNIRRALCPAGCVCFLFLVSAVATAAEQQANGLAVRHRAGQTLLTFQEVDTPVPHDSIEAGRLKALRRDLDATARVRYRIYRSDRPIRSVDGLEPIAELPPLTGWNADFHGADPKPGQMALRYVVEEGKEPVPPGTGVFAYHPKTSGNAYYVVTRSVDGNENRSIGMSNSLQSPIHETVGQGVPILQRIERPESFSYVDGPTLYYYVRWESGPNCAMSGRPFDYLVAVPPNLAKPAPVGIHLHCWGGSLNGGYGWWYGAEQGHLLIASNQIPYDWWTGYHESYWKGPPDETTWKQGVVRPYSQTRMLSFLDWVATRWDIDPTRTHVAGSSMGGSGSPMFAIRHPERIAWCVSWVGVHNPADSPHFKGSYENVYGRQEWGVKFENGTPVWDHFNDAWYLRTHPQEEIGLIAFSNGKNDSGIGWPQAMEFYRALQDTRRPHVFVWGQRGHGQRAQMPRTLSDRQIAMDLRTDQSQPAFSHCSLDDDPGDGDPEHGAPVGQVNLYLYWETDDIVDQSERWAMTVRLVDRAPEDQCTVDITPRRLQQFKLRPGEQVSWTNRSANGSDVIQSVRATADEHGLVTLEDVRVDKEGNRIEVSLGR